MSSLSRSAFMAGAAALLLSGCTATRPLASPVDYEMTPGTTVRLGDGATLSYTRVVADSRCPERVVCVHAGWAEVEFAYVRNGGPGRTLVLSTRPGGSVARTPSGDIELLTVGRDALPPVALRVSPTAD